MPGDASGTARLTLLGGFALTSASGASVPVTGRKAQGLLAILALAPGMAASRDRLVALLWSDRDDSHARNSLRQVLTALRRELEAAAPGLLSAERDRVALDPARLAVDVLAFQAAVETDPEAAATLYVGPFLDAFHLRDDAFERWAADERARLVDLAITVRQRLAESGPDRVAHARALVALDPLREASHRALMAALAASGERDLALRQFDTCRELLADELDTTPAPETEALRDRIAAGYADRNTEKAARPAAAVDPPATAAIRPALAVLRFRNLSADAGDAFFAEGLSEDIITNLSRVRHLSVTARNSSATYADGADIRQVGAELGVGYVLEGTVRRAGERLRVTAQLVETATGRHVWSDRYDGDLADIFAVQDDISRRIIGALQPGLKIAEAERLFRKPPDQLTAWECAVRAFARPGANRDDYLARIELFRRAVEIAPDYATAHGELGLEAGSFISVWGGNSSLTLPMARAHAERAIRLDPYDASGYVALSFADFLSLDSEGAVRNARRGVELAPSMANAHLILGYALWSDGAAAEALAAYDEFTRLSPRDPYVPWTLHGRAMALFLLGRYDEALESEGRALAIWTDWPQPWRLRAVALTMLGRHDEAREAVRRALAIKPDETITALRSRLPLADPAQNARYFGALRQAGFPE